MFSNKIVVYEEMANVFQCEPPSLETLVGNLFHIACDFMIPSGLVINF